jgi:ABC-type branched-subunit amino acid transport system substrate-binding protein
LEARLKPPPAVVDEPGMIPRTPVVAIALCAVVTGCQETPAAVDEIPIGVMLSYTGQVAANSINSERALLLAVETVNAAGGVAGRRLRVVAKNTRSDTDKTLEATRQLIDAGTPVILGPDSLDLVVMVRPLLETRTLILPSFATSSIDFKPQAWLVMGAAPARVACELVAQLAADGRKSPMVIANPTGYNSRLSWEMSNGYGMPKFVLPNDDVTSATVMPLTARSADAFVLAAFPASASSLVYALTALNALKDPTRWYLGPTLHTPAFREFIPSGALDGAHGVAPGGMAGAADFRSRFAARWHAATLDDAYAFYDAGAIAALALARALAEDGAIPTGTGLFDHILKVTKAGGTPISWDGLAHGLELLEQHKDIQYLGISGATEFDASGQTPTATTSWWTVSPAGFTAIGQNSDCH